MKKKIIQLSVAVVLLAGVITAMIVLMNYQPEPEPAPILSPAPEVIMVAGSETQDFVKSVQIDNEFDTYTVRNLYTSMEAQTEDRKSLCAIDGYGDAYPVNNTMLFSVINASASLRATQVIGNGDYASFGLTKPRATAEIEYESGKLTLLIGNTAPGNEGIYMATSRDDSVYLVSSYVAENYLKPKLDYLDKTLTGGVAGETMYKAITLSGEAYPETIAIAETPDTAQEAGGMILGTHGIIAPISARLDSQRAQDKFAPLFGLVADAIAAEDQSEDNLKKFGLDEPYTVISVVADDPELGGFELVASKPDAEGNVYLIRKDSPLIYRIPNGAVPWLEVTLFELMEKMAILPNIDTVATVELSTKAKLYKFELSGESDELQVLFEGQEMDVPNFRQFYQTMIAASYSEVADDEPTGQPVLTYTYRFRSGAAPAVLSFWEGPSRKYYVQLNDGAYYFTQSLYVDRVLEDVVKFANGEKVKSYF